MPCPIDASKLTGITVDNGRLHLLQPLGRGSGGVVFDAVDTTSHIHYAVKCVLKAKKGTRQHIFQERELNFHQRVSHNRNIITLHRIIEDEPYIFIVMDLCAGGDLFKFLTEKGTFRRNDALVKSVFVQLIDAVDACHRNGIYHRDIKPENVMCNEDGTQVKLGDFGLSTDSKWSRNFGAGTSAYMSPDCIGAVREREAYSSPSNDVWSLGVILTSMISGHNPWRQAAMSDACFKAYVYNPDFFRLMLPISRAADAILRGIFTNYENRISLRKLRRMVLAVDTFFMSEDEIAKASTYVQMAAASYLCDIDPSPTREGVSATGGNDVALAVEEVNVTDEKGEFGVIEIFPFSPRPQTTNSPETDREPHSHISTLVSSDLSDMINASAEDTKRPVPMPQPMPSYHELMRPEVEDPEALGGSKKRRRTCGSDSPVGLLRRWMERIFV